MADYTAPVSPQVVFDFQAETYTPPVSPSVVFNFGVEIDPVDDGYLKSSYMMLLPM